MKSLDEIVPDHRSTVIFDAIDSNGREVVCVPVSLYRVTRKTVLRELRDLGIENVYYHDGARVYYFPVDAKGRSASMSLVLKYGL